MIYLKLMKMMTPENASTDEKVSQFDDLILLPAKVINESTSIQGIESRSNPFLPKEKVTSIKREEAYKSNTFSLSSHSPLKEVPISNWFSRLNGLNTIVENLTRIDDKAQKGLQEAKNSIEMLRKKNSFLNEDSTSFTLNQLSNLVNSMSLEERQTLKEQIEQRLAQYPRDSFLIKNISEKKLESSLETELEAGQEIEQEFHRLLKKMTDIFLENLSEITEFHQKYKQIKPIFINFLSELKACNNNEDLACLLEIVEEFTSKSTPLYFANMSRVGVAIELLNQFVYPWKVNQWDSNLCGMAAIISIFSVNFPKLFLKNCVEFAEKGSLTFPIKLAVKGEQWRNNPTVSLLIPFIMAAMRNHYNMTGYSPKCFFEPLRGATRPKTLVKILEQAGFNEIEEDMRVVNSKGNPISSPLQTFLGGVYSKQHFNHSPEQGLTRLIEQMNQGKHAIILISLGIMHYFTGEEEPLANAYLFSVSFGHFVYLRECQIIDQEVKLKIHTYGEEYEAVIPIEIFLLHFRGSVCATAPQMTIAEEVDCSAKENMRIC